MDTIGNILAATMVPGIDKRFAVTSGILDLWSAILPGHLSFFCRPSMLIDGVLTVECLSPSHAFDLRCDSHNIIIQLRQHFGNKVRKLNIVLIDH